MNKYKIDYQTLSAVIFDFDGVLTNNTVLVDKSGGEWVRCSRSDGLAFDALKKSEILSFIVSTEKNGVVTARANKIKVPVVQGVEDKVKAIKDLSLKHDLDLKRVLYVGNDLNDYYAMSLCGISACPIDSHPRILDLASFILNTKGGDGVVRELVEDVFEMDLLEVLYAKSSEFAD
ncbi:MAG: hypothetical protein COB04_01315 [Gammaproteobacteria bacterium]|nr:MAG: hypothetical protein COB04_01315 [Gammaproteobacteria bacterium]